MLVITHKYIPAAGSNPQRTEVTRIRYVHGDAWPDDVPDDTDDIRSQAVELIAHRYQSDYAPGLFGGGGQDDAVIGYRPEDTPTDWDHAARWYFERAREHVIRMLGDDPTRNTQHPAVLAEIAAARARLD